MSDAELLAVVIRSGSRRETALTLCQRLLAQDEADPGLAGLLGVSLEELMRFPGIGKVKACQMKAALEIGARAVAGGKSQLRPPVRTPADALALIETDMRALPREELRMILLDTRSRLIRTCRVAEGGLSMSVIHPRAGSGACAGFGRPAGSTTSPPMSMSSSAARRLGRAPARCVTVSSRARRSKRTSRTAGSEASRLRMSASSVGQSILSIRTAVDSVRSRFATGTPSSRGRVFMSINTFQTL